MRVMVGAASLAAFTFGFAACSSSAPPASAGDVTREAGVPEAGGAVDGVHPFPPGYDVGVGLGLADVADTPCVARGGLLDVVLPAGGDASPRPPSFRSLRVAGDRRVAEIADGSGFVVFDGDGKNAKLVATTLLAGDTATLGGGIVIGGKSDARAAAAQLYAASGVAAGAPLTLASEEVVAGFALGADDEAALAVWASSTNVRARGVAGGAVAGDAGYDFAVAAMVHSPSIAVSSVKPGLFAVVFSGDDEGSRHQTAFGRGTKTARVGDPSNLFTGEVPRRVVGLARTPAGFALLVTVEDGANPYAMLVLTDAGGRRTSAGLKLAGTVAATGIAVNGSEIAVLAHRREGTAFEAKTGVELRIFDLDGHPLAPWVCLEAPGSETDLGGGIVTTGAGYAALFRASDGSAALARFDHLGTGSP
jgi:hypothetical protein